jgi:hypothetical protein
MKAPFVPVCPSSKSERKTFYTEGAEITETTEKQGSARRTRSGVEGDGAEGPEFVAGGLVAGGGHGGG